MKSLDNKSATATTPKQKIIVFFVLALFAGVIFLVVIAIGSLFNHDQDNNASQTKTAPSSSSTKSQSATSTPPTTKGFLDTVAWWDQNHTATATAVCSAQGDKPTGTERAWSLASTAVACYDDTTISTWSGHMVAVNIYFPALVSEQQALTSASSLLPDDQKKLNSYDGTNPSYSATPTGTCRQVVFSSITIGNKVHMLDPQWSGDPNKVTFTLYTGQANSENGSTKAYDPAKVNLVSIGIGGENRGNDGIVHC